MSPRGAAHLSEAKQNKNSHAKQKQNETNTNLNVFKRKKKYLLYKCLGIGLCMYLQSK